MLSYITFLYVKTFILYWYGMSTTMLIAKLLFPVFALVTITAFIRPKFFKEVTKDLLNHHALIYIASFISLIGGTAIILYHNTWTQDWSTLITILGWLSAVKGVMHMLFPKATIGAVSEWTQSKGFIYFAGIVCAVISVILYSLAYMA